MRRLGVSDSARRMNGGGEIIHILRGSKMRAGPEGNGNSGRLVDFSKQIFGDMRPCRGLGPKDGACTDEGRAV